MPEFLQHELKPLTVIEIDVGADPSAIKTLLTSTKVGKIISVSPQTPSFFWDFSIRDDRLTHVNLTAEEYAKEVTTLTHQFPPADLIICHGVASVGSLAYNLGPDHEEMRRYLIKSLFPSLLTILNPENPRATLLASTRHGPGGNSFIPTTLSSLKKIGLKVVAWEPPEDKAFAGMVKAYYKVDPITAIICQRMINL